MPRLSPGESFGDNGVVVGASFTNIHVELPILWFLMGLSIVAAIVACANLRRRTYTLPIVAAALVFGASFVLSDVVPGLFQRLFVKPNELQWERPYIQHNIELTQQAYNLHQIAVKPFPAEQDLTFKTLESNKATIENIRLWDWQPLMDTYAQLQEIRTYYKYITDNSRIMIRRDIQERVRVIAPFLRLDHDPYLVISDGRMFWMLDAYTTSTYFPYAKPTQDHDLNYIRNSVKVVIDAYNGTIDFYLIDSADPIAATYQRIFPSLFKPFAIMPPDLQKHIRYPEDLFLMQAQLYQAYHMDKADVFYNREDLWQFPRQPAGSGTPVMAPYYIIMRLPEEPQADFFVMLPHGAERPRQYDRVARRAL